MRAELYKSLRLSFSFQKILLAPILIYLFILAVFIYQCTESATEIFVISDDTLIGLLSSSLFVFAIALFTTYKNNENSFIEEFNEGTWQFIRTSSMKSYQLLSQKYIGNSWYGWYLFLLALPVFIFSAAAYSKIGIILSLIYSFEILLLIFLAQIIGQLNGLSIIKNGRETNLQNVREKGFLVLVFFIIFVFISSSVIFRSDADGLILWFGYQLPIHFTVILSMLLCIFLSVITLYDVASEELQSTKGPWLRVLAILLFTIYIVGFLDVSLFGASIQEYSVITHSIYRLYLGTIILLSFLYLSLFQENFTYKKIRKLTQELKLSKIVMGANTPIIVPLFCLSLFFVILSTLIELFLGADLKNLFSSNAVYPERMTSVQLMTSNFASMYLLLNFCRDFLLFFLIALLFQGKKNYDRVKVLYFLLFYCVLPLIFKLLGGPLYIVIPAFAGISGGLDLMPLVVSMIWLLVLAQCCWQKWNKLTAINAK